MDRRELLRAARENIANSRCGIMNFLGGKIIVLPTVFPADCSTPFLATTMARVAAGLVKRYGGCRVLEVGCGSGGAILTVAREPGVEASATDINPMASLCTQANALWWGVKCTVYQGSLFEQINQREFDLIFWNIPFLKDELDDIEDVRFRAGFDPGYRYLTQFLQQVQGRLSGHGEVYLGADRKMCDLDDIYARARRAGFNVSVFDENKEVWNGLELIFLILRLTRVRGAGAEVTRS